jgi:hypothetical protein
MFHTPAHKSMSQEAKEQQLIEAIKAKPGYKVFFGTDNASVIVVRESKNSVGQQSVWLGRKNSVANLQKVLAQ